MKLLNGSGFRRLESAMNAAELRQKVVSNNIANNDTPYYKRSEVLFEEMLGQAMSNQTDGQLALKRTDARHIGNGGTGDIPQSIVRTDEHTVMNNNVNNVDIDREMALLAKNQLRYNAFIDLVNHDVRMMRTGIDGRG
ncbi:flagellar basal body rod protein FlgB [Paenibacillaceae bacterium]|nr:flagellar basal body rod protein FlgB [Paenibacillaceae bacterium]